MFKSSPGFFAFALQGESTVFSLGLILVILIVIMLVFSIYLIRWMRRTSSLEMEDILKEHVPGEIVNYQDDVNFFGQKSKGRGRVRGNGIMALTDKHLVFRMLLPARWIKIPLEMIQSVERAKLFMGKGYGGPIMLVNFTNDQGNGDSCGFAVRIIDKWEDEFRNLGITIISL